MREGECGRTRRLVLTKSKEGRGTIMTEERRTMKMEEGGGEVE